MSSSSFSHDPDSFAARELRLKEIREQAERELRAKTNVNERLPTVGIASPETGYYGLPLLKKPAWTWEIPIYFFVGGAAGAAAVVGNIAKMTGADPKLVNDARWLAAIGGAISPALLVADLGMPSRFIHMLRVFKIQSPMSVGSWTLVFFSTSSAAAAFSSAVQKRSGSNGLFRVFESAADFSAALTGTVLCTYTGVLVGATAIPAWNQNVSILPVHFAASGLSSAVSILELRGNYSPALNSLGVVSALCETALAATLEVRKKPAQEPLHKGRSGWLMRAAGLLSGPIPLLLRLFAGTSTSMRSKRLRNAAAISSITGSLATRVAWVQAGKESAVNPAIPLQLPPASRKDRIEFR
ncbi:MAG: NrfD/PsrC family molybdoenzyme membrane anchor subunit [Candidatus Acidiferrales bacterium]